MTTLHIRQPHRLPPAQVRDRVEHLARALKSQWDMDYHWEGDRLLFRRSGAEGYIEVGEDYVDFSLTLGLLLRPMKGRIEESIRCRLAQELGHNSTTGT